MRKLYLLLAGVCFVNIAYWSFSEHIRGGEAINGLIDGVGATLLAIAIGGFIPLVIWLIHLGHNRR